MPDSVRIRTDDGNEWRYDAIQAAANYYGCGKSDTIAYACEDVTESIEFARSVLNRNDLTISHRQEVAELANRHLRDVYFEIDTGVRRVKK